MTFPSLTNADGLQYQHTSYSGALAIFGQVEFYAVAVTDVDNDPRSSAAESHDIKQLG